MNVGIEALLIETTRVHELAEFYRSGFELPAPDTVAPDQVGFQIGDVYFGLEQVDDATVPSGTMSLWFKVEDARAVYDRLLTLGAKTKDAPEDVEDEVIASVFDPDGNVIGLLSDL
jgi:predicted enzyme related to lactoylglutathione lyase